MMMQQQPAVEGNGHSPHGQKPTLERLFGWRPNSGFLAPREMLTFGGEPGEYAPRSKLTEQQAADRLLMIVEDMVWRDGTVDLKVLDLHESMLSVAVNGLAREQVVTISTGGVSALQEGHRRRGFLDRLLGTGKRDDQQQEQQQDVER